MIRRWLLGFSFLVLCVENQAFGAQAHSAQTTSVADPFGLGLVVGDPIAVTAKYWLNSRHAIDFGVDFFESNYLLLYGDYLFHFPGGFGHGTRFASELSPYIGVGAAIASFSGDYYRTGKYYWHANNPASFGLGARFPFGVEWLPSRARVGVFFELVPGLALVPGADLFLQFGLGARYYF
jgi:hypothetical protein